MLSSQRVGDIQTGTSDTKDPFHLPSTSRVGGTLSLPPATEPLPRTASETDSAIDLPEIRSIETPRKRKSINFCNGGVQAQLPVEEGSLWVRDVNKKRDTWSSRVGSLIACNPLKTSRIPLPVPQPDQPPSPVLHDTVYTTRLPSVVLQTINYDNICYLRQINSLVFPVKYADSFYRDVLGKHPPELSWLAYHSNTPVGAICCRKEELVEPPNPTLNSPSPKSAGAPLRIYIMTVGVLTNYRRYRIGSMLLEHIEGQARADERVQHICLHVQTTNTAAIQFYERHGFTSWALCRDYYKHNKGVEPPHALFLVKVLREAA
ncbi:acyl-CoA N-acyltransferase [Gaertneriomyces semiglobifer]|nr:acyl-CoA N-acyltransferase [Gaertneriomyces semiglobifer]